MSIPIATRAECPCASDAPGYLRCINIRDSECLHENDVPEPSIRIKATRRLSLDALPLFLLEVS